ncbi:MAG: Chemotaxis protein histidine kinaselike protein [Acidobacteria bacterium]|nr:Chemotaxis protein histidine kinaselike protein [Acidobacteriota bacterium]
MDLRTQREFLVDLEELVEQLFADTEELRQQEAQGPVRRELLASIFRHVHSIKGVAATAGFNSVSELAHQTETLLDGARSGRVTVAALFVELLDEAANAISESLSAMAAGTDPASSTSLMQSIQNLSQQNVPVQTGMPLPDLPSDFAAALNVNEKESLLEALRQDEKIYLVNAHFDLAVFDKEFHDLRTILAQQGTVISSMPSADSSRPDRVGFRILYSSELALPDLQNELATFPKVVISTVPVTSAAAQCDASTLAPESIPAVTATTPASSFVRIEIEELDRLISASHELFGQTVLALDLVSDNLAADSQTELKNLDAQIRQSLVSLEEQIIQLRMVSPERVMQRAVRAGRVAARVSGKEIEFSIVGSKMRIDKVAGDAIADPLLHLVRNAVDQGIETPTERVQAGKSPLGRVRIEASSHGGRVRVVVIDDGRGIDPEVVSQAAVKQGLIAAGTLLSSAKSLRLIFRPGFSTAATVSNVSGRGVGLDIVERAIERAGGAVRVRTQVGQGTEFEIRLPASLGVLRALVVVSDGHRYCVDASQLVDQCEMDPGVQQELASAQTFHWRNETMPLSDLRGLLAQPPVQSSQRWAVLVCDLPKETAHGEPAQNDRQAIIVDAIEGTQEVLVRGLGRHAALWPGVVGAAELWDGTLALVLDLPLLVSVGSS